MTVIIVITDEVDCFNSAFFIFYYYSSTSRHCFNTGRSGARLCHVILRSLADVLSHNVDPSQLPAPDPHLAIAPPISDVMSIPLKRHLLLLEGLRLPYAWLTGRLARTWMGVSSQMHVPPLQRFLNIRFVEVHAMEVDKLLVACRAHGTTLHALIVASLSIAAWRCSYLDESFRKDDVIISTESAVDMRRYISTDRLPSDSYGLHTSLVGSDVEFSNTPADVWELARGIKQRITSNVMEGLDRFVMARAFGHPGNILRYLDAAAYTVNGRTATLAVSNLGPVDIDDVYGCMRVAGLRFYLDSDRHVVGIGVATFAGRMSITLSCLREAVPDSLADAMAHELSSVLGDVGRGVGLFTVKNGQ